MKHSPPTPELRQRRNRLLYTLALIVEAAVLGALYLFSRHFS
jgi:hypothetical protein